MKARDRKKYLRTQKKASVSGTKRKRMVAGDEDRDQILQDLAAQNKDLGFYGVSSRMP